MKLRITRKEYWGSSKLAGFGLALALGGASFLVTPPVSAQQPAAERQKLSPLAREWLDLRRRFSSVEIEDAPSAATTYREFYERHFSGASASQEGELAVEIVSRRARLLALEIGERDQALELLKAAIGRWREPRLLAILQREYESLSDNNTLMASPVAPPLTNGATAARSAAEVPAVRTARVAPLLELLAAQQDAYLLWESGKWNADDVVWALEYGINSHGVIKGRPQEQGKQVRYALAGLLARQGGERLQNENWRALPLQVRLWLGDYYRQAKDERAAPLLQSVVDDAQQLPGAATSRDLFFAAERLGWYWHAAGQHEKSAAAWLRLEAQPNERAYAFLQAAREREHAGNPAEAKRLYELALKSGHPQVTVAVLLDRARELRGEGQLQSAADALRGASVEAVPLAERLPLFSELSLVLYQQGQFAAARESAQSALDGRAALSSNPVLHRALNAQQDPYLLQAKRTIEWSARWEKAPLQVLPAQINARRGETVRLSVRSYAQLPLQIVFENAPMLPPNAAKQASGASSVGDETEVEEAQKTVQNTIKLTTARLRADGWTGQRSFYFEQEVEVQVETAGTLILSCPAPTPLVANDKMDGGAKQDSSTVRWETRVPITLAP